MKWSTYHFSLSQPSLPQQPRDPLSRTQLTLALFRERLRDGLGLREYLEATRKSSRNYQAQSFVYPRFTEMDNEEMFEMVAEWVLAEIKIPMLTECFQESFDLMNFCIEPKRNRKIRPRNL